HGAPYRPGGQCSRRTDDAAAAMCGGPGGRWLGWRGANGEEPSASSRSTSERPTLGQPARGPAARRSPLHHLVPHRLQAALAMRLDEVGGAVPPLGVVLEV